MADNKKILVADDSLFSREVIKDILKKNGYDNIIEADDGCETLEAYDRERPGVVILDLIMDKMDGVETLERLMDMDIDAQVIVASALGQEAIVDQCKTLGCRGYIVKPIDEKSLMAEIKKVVERP